MKAIVITIIACATAITCVVLLRVYRPPEGPRYQLYGVDETSSENGKTVKSVYRVDTITGRTWRVSSSPLPTGAVDAQHKPVAAWVDAWEEMPESPRKQQWPRPRRAGRALSTGRARHPTEPAEISATPRWWTP